RGEALNSRHASSRGQAVLGFPARVQGRLRWCCPGKTVVAGARRGGGENGTRLGWLHRLGGFEAVGFLCGARRCYSVVVVEREADALAVLTSAADGRTVVWD